MFNIYYINYAKAYEIAMLLDNKILEQITKEHNAEGGITGVAETGTGGMTEIPLVGRYLPKLSLNGEFTGSKSSKVMVVECMQTLNHSMRGGGLFEEAGLVRL